MKKVIVFLIAICLLFGAAFSDEVEPEPNIEQGPSEEQLVILEVLEEEHSEEIKL